MTKSVITDLFNRSFPSVFTVSERLLQTVLCQGTCFLKGTGYCREKQQKTVVTQLPPLTTSYQVFKAELKPNH